MGIGGLIQSKILLANFKFGNLFLFKFITVMKPKSLETTWNMGHDGFMQSEILLALKNIVFLKAHHVP